MARVPQGRVTLGGTLSAATERWTTSFAIDPLSARSQGQLDDIAEAVGGLWESYVWADADAGELFSFATAFTDVRVDDVRDPGGVVRTAHWVRSEPLVGASEGAQLPPQCSEVCTLLTGLPGPRFRGRMYLPPVSAFHIAGGGILGSGATATLAQAMADFISQVNLSATVAATVFVASDAAQQLTAVSSVRVGNIIDTQRRRRDALDEAYSTVGVITS